MSALVLDHVSAGLGGRRVLDDVSLTVAPGELTALTGPNGAGKTSLLKAALGLIGISAGYVSLSGAPLAGLGVRERARRASWLAQERASAWAISGADLVSLGRFAVSGGLPYARLARPDREAVDEALARTGACELAARSVHTLSGGEAARLHLARALAARAPLLLADEPGAGLDPRHQIEAMEILRAEAARGAGVLVVLHDLEAARRFADRAAVMDQGRIVALGAPGEVLDDELLARVFAVRRAPGGGFERA